MQKLTRGLVGTAGVLALLMAVGFWLRPAELGGKLGLEPVGALGLASLRADLGGFFGAAGVFALLAAVRNRRDLLLVPITLIGIALAGRLLSLALTGFSQPLVQPIVIEAVLIVIMVLGFRGLSKSSV